MIDNYFEKIDTQEKSYFLGLMYSDGNVYKRKDRPDSYRIQLKLNINDRYIIEEFSKEIQCHIKIRDEKDGSRLIFTNKIFAKHLINQGCIPKKSLTKNFPKNISDKYMGSFVRGYLDGNGNMSLRKNRLIIRIYSGSEKFIYGLEDILSSKNINITNIYDNTKLSGIYSLELGRKLEVEKFLKFIYSSKNNCYLKRKYSIVCQYRDNLYI